MTMGDDDDDEVGNVDCTIADDDGHPHQHHGHDYRHQTDPVDDEVWDILRQVVCPAPQLDTQRQHWAEEFILSASLVNNNHQNPHCNFNPTWSIRQWYQRQQWRDQQPRQSQEHSRVEVVPANCNNMSYNAICMTFMSHICHTYVTHMTNMPNLSIYFVNMSYLS